MNKVVALVATILAATCNTSDPTPALARPAAPKGRVETQHFHSDALGVDKAVVVWLPGSYDAHPDRRYPVFVYLHGLGGQETDWTQLGHLDDAANAIGLDAIVVMPDGDDGFYLDSPTPADYDACMKDGTGLFYPGRDHAATCVRANNYETYIAHDLVSWVDKTYRTKATRGSRAIAGLSMGGYGALMLAMRHSDEFAAAASHSGVVAPTYVGPHPYAAGHAVLLDDDMLKVAPSNRLLAWVGSRFGGDLGFWRDHDPSVLAGKLAPNALAVYFDCGTEDGFKLDDQARYLHDVLSADKLDHSWYLGPGQHDFAFWSARVGKSLVFLRDHTSS
jgi:S-formylglutathione hydrolase FrmB